MPCFPFYARHPTLVPATRFEQIPLVISPPDCSAEFKPMANAHRKRRWKQLLLLALIFLYALCVPHLPGHTGAALAAYIAVGIVGVIAFFAYPDVALICPGCKMDPDTGDGHFCPECGSESAKARQAVLLVNSSPKCEACGKVMSVGSRSGATYKIRFCRNCGAFLDDPGIRP